MRVLVRPVSRLAGLAGLGAACALLAGCSLSALEALAPKSAEPVPVVDTNPKRAWSPLQSTDAQPVWPVAAVPAAVSAVPQARLDALALGMNMSAVSGQLGAPHGLLKDPNGEEVWQYVVADAAANRAYIASFWFGPKGLWLATGRSRPIGELAKLAFGTPTLAAAPQAGAPAAMIAAAPPGGSAKPAAVIAAPPVAAAKPAPAAPPAVVIAAAPPSGSAQPAAAPAPASPSAPSAAAPTVAIAAAPPSGSAKPAAPAGSAPPPAPPVAASVPKPATAPPNPGTATSGASGPGTAASGAPSPGAGGVSAASADGVEEAALRQALAGWAQDWSSQNVAGYLARYTPDFVSPGRPRDEWESERRQRLTKPKFIRIKAEQVKVRWPGSVRPQLEFVQRYESNTYKDTSLKLLTFVKRDGRWLIEQEDSAPLPLSR